MDIFTLREWDYTHVELVDNAPVEPQLEIAFWTGPRANRPRVRDVRRAQEQAADEARERVAARAYV